MEFSAGSCIRFGWETFKKRGWFFVGTFLLLGIAEWILGSLNKDLRNDGTLIYLLAIVAVLLLSTLIDMGTNAFLLKAHDSVAEVKLRNLWHPQPFWSFLGASILSGLVIFIGFILVIIPGIIFAIMLAFVKLLVIDRNLGPIAAMKESVRITKGHRWELLALFFLILVINIVGAICLIVGLLVTIPVTSLAAVHAYRTLQQKAGSPAAA